MATATVLYVGDDLKLHVPVMQEAGLAVLRADCSIASISDTLERAESIDAIVFQSNPRVLTYTVITAVRALSESPIVLFQNSGSDHEEEPFDLVVPPLTHPAVWLQRLAETIRASRELHIKCTELCKKSEALVASSRALREVSAGLRASSINPDSFWRPESGEDSTAAELPEPKTPDSEN